MNIVKEMKIHANGYLRLSRQAPSDVAHLLRQLRSGKMKVHVHHEHLDKMAATIDNASKRNAVAVVIAALIVGSSLLISTDTALARLGVFGYITAGVLGVILIISILWGRDQ